MNLTLENLQEILIKGHSFVKHEEFNIFVTLEDLGIKTTAWCYVWFESNMLSSEL